MLDEARPGVVLVATRSPLDAVLPLIERCAERGVHVIFSSEELAWPDVERPESPHVSVERLVPKVRTACRYAAELGIRLSIETHTALPVIALVELVERVDAPKLGAVLDTANVVRVGSGLMEATRILARVTDMVHMKDLDLSAAGFGDPGGWWPCVSLGVGDLDLHGVLAELRSVGFAGFIWVELATPVGSDEDRMVEESVVRLRHSIALAGQKER